MVKPEIAGARISDWAALADRYEGTLAFGATFLLFLFVHQYHGVSTFYWDAGGYWELSALKNLLDFPDEIRGYFYPALLAPIRLLDDMVAAEGHLPFRVVSSALYAYVFSTLVPDFFVTCFGGRQSLQRRLVAPLLLSIVMPGVLIYPLSDLAALTLSFTAGWCVIKARSAPSKLAFFLVFLAGGLAYGAYNTRTIYIFPGFLLALSIPLLVYKGSLPLLRASFCATFVLGAAIASIPQIVINLKHNDVASPAVLTNGSGNNTLFAAQLLWGITVQKYETSVNPASAGAGLFYMDRAGEKFFAQHEIDSRNFSVEAYLQLMLNEPFYFAGLMGRHFVNGLDVRDGVVYSQGDSINRNIVSFVNFCIVFLGFVVVGRALTHRLSISQQTLLASMWAIYFLVPVVAIIPSALETRFFLSLHLTLYVFIAFKADQQLFQTLRRYWVIFILGFVLSAAQFQAISQATMAGLEYSYSDAYRGL